MTRAASSPSAPLVALLAFLAGSILSCAAESGRPRMAWSWFGTPALDDAWSEAVELWQERSGADVGAARDAARGATLRAAKPPTLAIAYLDFERERRRAFAREVTEWIQTQSDSHFISDGAVDRWGTLEEVLETNGDDCDGLALLSYHLLREFGFGEGELYQAIVYKAEDAQYHMVTLWFEDGDDPWVIDPTAAMTEEMVRMSSIEGWRPLKLFSEDEEYTVRRSRRPAVAAPPPARSR